MRASWVFVSMAVAALFVLRVPFLPPTLEDIDSVNFDLGVHDFDPIRHQPHPPGYAVFIAAAKLVHPFFKSHAAGLAFVSAVFGALTLIPLLAVMRAVAAPGAHALAVVLVLFNPLVWFNSVRPMSDTMGFCFVLTAQALLVMAIGGRTSRHLLRPKSDRLKQVSVRPAQADRLWRWGVFVAGLALGIRVQAIVLLGPLLLYGWWQRRSVWRETLIFLAAGVGLWLVPVIWLSGGAMRLWGSFVELLGNAVPVEPLVSRFTLDRARWAARAVFVEPWGPTWLAVIVLSLASAGLLMLAVRDRKRLVLLAVLFVPYAAYHYFVQMTEVLRYAIPVVPLIAVLAAEPLLRWRGWLGVPLPLAAAAFIGAASFVTAPALQAYHSLPSPIAQAIEGVRQHAGDGRDSLVSGNFVFNRYFDWLPPHLRQLAPQPHKEWRRLTEYWKGGGREPVLFLRDAMRTSLALVGRRSQTPLNSYRWPPPVAPFLDGARPSRIELIRIDPPRWFVESGFFLTEEAGPIADVMRETHRLYVDAEREPQALVLSGSISQVDAVPLKLRVGERTVQEWTLNGPFTLRAELTRLPATGYVPLTIDATAPVLFTDVLIEQPDRGSVRPTAGFYLPERDERAEMFRWMGPEAQAVAVAKDERVRLRLRGQVPVEYYNLPITVALSIDGRTLASWSIASKDFVLEHELPPDRSGKPRRLRLVTSHHFVPNDFEHNADRRQLSLRVYEIALEAIDARGG